MAVKFTVGTHNLHDETGRPTFFADLIVFTEAIAEHIRAMIPHPHKMIVCRQQPDLVLVYDSTVFRRDRLRKLRYTKYVDGWAGVTPNRGTFTVSLIHRATKRKVRVNAEHRINAAFPPYIRGEGPFRSARWKIHTAGTLGTMERQEKAGLLVVTAGDDNTPHGVRAYPGFNEVGTHFDRIGSTAELGGLEELSRVGSDHLRIRATATEKEKQQ